MKALVGVKYGKMTSAPKTRHKSKGSAKMSGRSGPPMVDIGSKGERVGTAKSAMPVRQRGARFSKGGSVSERDGHTGPDHRPSIGSPKERSGRVGPY